MQDTFQWTDELVQEFVQFTLHNSPVFQGRYKDMEQFKSSKSPKKEWEIVAYQVRDKNVYYPEYTDDIGRIWGNAEWKGAFIDSADVNHPDVNIFSVRRLSDGEVFTKNEVVETPKDGQHHIGGFEIVGNDLVANFSTGKLLLKHLQKLPQPILTTADQKDLFSRQDGVWVVNKDNEIIHRYVDTILDHGYVFQDCRFYSTPEAARDYVLNHAPLLSLNDVKYIMDNTNFSHYAAKDSIMSMLVNAVKQKLNQ